MPTPQSSLIIKHYEGFGGNFLDSQYLGFSYDAAKPHVFENTLMKMYSSRSRFFTGGKLLTAMLGTGASYSTKEIEGDVWRWTLQGAEHRSAIVTEVVETSTTPGLGLTTFRVKLDINYFARPDVLMGEDNDFTMEIVEGPIPDGEGYVYTLRLQGDNPSRSFPVSELAIGKRFEKVWTSVASEMNQEYGTQQAPSSFMLENQLGYFAQKITVTDKALRTEGRLGVKFIMTDEAGKQTQVSRFLPLYEARMQDELYSGIEAALVYGKKETRPATNGYALKTGSGMREQIKDGWVRYYNGVLTVNLLRDYLMDIFFTRENENQRSVKIMTGTLGSILFHQALANLANGFLTVDTHFIRSAQGVGPTPGLAFGAQYTKYNGPNGIEVELYMNPLYDSTMYCKKFHPLYPNMPIDSARMTVLDFGSSEGKDNICMVKEKNSFTSGYVPGMVTPSGPNTGGATASLNHAYERGIQTSAGLHINDVSRTGELILAMD